LSFVRVRRLLTTKIRPSGGLLLALLSLMLFAVNLILGAAGLRGTDQYWYVGDLWMSQISGQPVTNAIYPTATGINADISTNGLPPRIHNVPVTYLASLAHQLGASDYLAWVYVNVLIALIVAVVVYVVATKLKYSCAFIAPTLFLSFPLTLWLSINALADMSLALGSCLLILGATCISRADADEDRKFTAGLLLIATASVLMFYTRDNYVLLFPALILFTFWASRSRRKRWVPAAAILSVTALLAALKPSVLPQYPHAGLLSMLMTGTPSDNVLMSPYYSLGNVPFSASEFIFKMMNGLKDAILPSGPSELISELPVIVVVVGALFFLRKDDTSRILRFWMSVVFAIYLTTAAIFQSENRYIFALVPFMALFGAGLWNQFIRPSARLGWRANVLKLALVCFLIVCIFGSFLMARAYRTQATVETAQTSRLISGFAAEPMGSVLALTETAKLLPLTYAAVPRPVLAINTRINTTAQAARLIEIWKVRVLVGASDKDRQYFSSAVDLAFGGGAKLISEPSYETPGGPIKLWLIELETNK